MSKKGSKIFDNIVWEEVNKESKMILEDYILEMKSRRLKDKTIEQYVFDIKAFLCWAYDELGNKSLLKFKKRDYRRFFLGLQERGCSPARINRVQCSLRNMLTFVCADDDEYEEFEVNPMSFIKGLPKEPVREIHFIENDVILKMIDMLVEKGETQKALYLALSYDSAGRRNEIRQVEKHGILENKKTNQVVGKRGKKFSLIYFDKTKEVAEKWLEERGEDDIDALFVSGRGSTKRPASYETLYDWCVAIRDVYEEITGEYVTLNPHAWRHSAAQCLKDGTHYALNELGKDNLDLEIIRLYMNHTDVSTTQKYLKNQDEEMLAEAFGL